MIVFWDLLKQNIDPLSIILKGEKTLLSIYIYLFWKQTKSNFILDDKVDHR